MAPRPRRVGEASRSRRVHPASTVFFGSLAGLWVLALLLGQTPAMAQDDDRIWVPYTSTNTDSGSSSVTVPRGQGYGQTVPEITPDLQRIYQQTIPGQARPQGLPSQGTFQEPGQLLIEKGPKKPTFAEEALPGLPPQPFETKEEKKEKAEALLLDRAKKTIEDEEPQPPPVRLAPAIEEPASSIEKAYRLQYSDVILDQLSVLEHAEPPEVQKREDEEELDSLRVKEEKPRYPDADIVEKYFTQFGYDLFKERAFRASEKMIVSDDYRLGPGDVLRVNMWGAGADVQFHGVIEPDGTISLPRLGVIPLAGTRFGDLERIITTEANKHFQGVDISVAIVRPRSVEVYVVGQVKRPGLTMIPAFSTMLTALTQAGGALKTGSLRNISLFRKGRLFRRLDLYDLIIRGHAGNDVFLEDKDVIHVPYIGPTIAVVGAVPRPGIFEIHKKTLGVDQALALAGGAVAQAQAKVYVRRFEKQRALNVLDVDLTHPKLPRVQVQAGDLLEVRFIGRRFPTTVRLAGHVWDRLEFSWQPGMKLSRVLPGPERLKPDAITDYCLVKRYDPDRAEYGWLRVPLSAVWKKQSDFDLKPHDVVFALSKEAYGISRSVHLQGAVWQPGEYKFKPGMTLRDLIGMGGRVEGRGRVDLRRVKPPEDRAEPCRDRTPPARHYQGRKQSGPGGLGHGRRADGQGRRGGAAGEYHRPGAIPRLVYDQ